MVPEFLFPKQCPFCGKVIGFTECICCENELSKLAFPAGPIEKSSPGKVYANLQDVYACFEYEGLVRQALLDVKKGGREDVIRSLARYYINLFNEENLSMRYDLLLPIPATKDRVRERGYNQTVLFTNEINKIVSIPVCKDVLYKTKNTKSQMTLS